MIIEHLSHKEKKEFKLAKALGVKWNKKLFLIKTGFIFSVFFILPNILGFVYDVNFKILIFSAASIFSLLLIRNIRVKSQRKIIPLGYEKLCLLQQKFGNLLKSIKDNKNNDTRITDEKLELYDFVDWYCWITQLSISRDKNVIIFQPAFSDCTFPMTLPDKFKDTLRILKAEELYKINIKMNKKYEVEKFEFSLPQT